MAISELRSRLAKLTRRRSASTTPSLLSTDVSRPTSESEQPSSRFQQSRHCQLEPDIVVSGTREKLESHALRDKAPQPRTEGSENKLDNDANQSLHVHYHDHQAPSLPQHQPSDSSRSSSNHLVTSSSCEASLRHHKHDSLSTTDLPTPASESTFSAVPRNRPSSTSTYLSDTTPAAAIREPTLIAVDSAGLRDDKHQQSNLQRQQARLIPSLVYPEGLPSHGEGIQQSATRPPVVVRPNMGVRKIWVRRPGASATLVSIHEDDLVDDVRDMILKKYANSLGRSFDSPDVTLRVCPHDQRQERSLGPEEQISRVVDEYYPGGQTVDEALIIDVPLRRTPRPSPHVPHMMGYQSDDLRPAEGDTDYFPPMPAVIPSPRLQSATPVQSNGHVSHAMSVLTTGHVPNLPSPGSTRRHHRERPRASRAHTSSPTVLTGLSAQPGLTSNGTQLHPRVGRARTHSSASEKSASAPTAPPSLPTPPLSDAAQMQRVATPPPRVSSPRPSSRLKKSKKNADHGVPTGMLNNAVPPISVLIVEDNIINLKLLEAFMKRLRVRWQTAMNGREAVNKWRAGGFHLVLMDIQLPVMSGLDATREIRRLERLNNIGVFSSTASSPSDRHLDEASEPTGDDQLPNTILFKSPVIIVALTASSLQSDRHEALAAGCNDFLTKPVNFVWLERKVMEWGCMQALIDYDGWRKWKDFSQQNDDTDAKKAMMKNKNKKNRMSIGNSSTSNLVRSIKEEVEDTESKENVNP